MTLHLYLDDCVILTIVAKTVNTLVVIVIVMIETKSTLMVVKTSKDNNMQRQLELD